MSETTKTTKPRRDLCCYCVPLRLTIGLLSLIFLGIAGASAWQKYDANDTGDTKATIIIFVACGIQVLIGLLGLLSALTKSVKITKGFFYLWWIFAVAVLGLSAGSLYLVAKNDREAIEAQCRKSLIPDNGLSPTTKEVEDCFKMVLIISGVVLGIQLLVICYIGYVISRFLNEVKYDLKENNEEESNEIALKERNEQ